MNADLAPAHPAPAPVPADVAARRGALLADGVGTDVADVVAGWLLAQRSPHTRRAYGREAARWLTWCATVGVHPWAVRRPHTDGYARTLTGAASSTARALSALSSLYAYAADTDVVPANPWASVKRPTQDPDHSSTSGLTPEQTAALITAARADSPRAHALVVLLYTLGVRVGELLSATVADLGHDRGHRTITVTRKGGRRASLPLPPLTVDAVESYLSGRTGGPLIATATGRPMDEPAVWRTLRRLATTAGIPDAVGVHPHTLRHAAITDALDAGAPLRDVQDMAGHRDPRTTRRYDTGRGRLDRSPTYTVAAAMADRLDHRGDA